jgi:hypothetical protein
VGSTFAGDVPLKAMRSRTSVRADIAGVALRAVAAFDVRTADTETGEEVDLHLVARIDEERRVHADHRFVSLIDIEIVTSEKIDADIDGKKRAGARAQAEASPCHASVGRRVFRHRNAHEA